MGTSSLLSLLNIYIVHRQKVLAKAANWDFRQTQFNKFVIKALLIFLRAKEGFSVS